MCGDGQVEERQGKDKMGRLLDVWHMGGGVASVGTRLGLWGI